MMTAFYLGTGPCDVGNTINFLGLGVAEGHTLYNVFYEIMQEVKNTHTDRMSTNYWWRIAGRNIYCNQVVI